MYTLQSNVFVFRTQVRDGIHHQAEGAGLSKTLFSYTRSIVVNLLARVCVLLIHVSSRFIWTHGGKAAASNSSKRVAKSRKKSQIDFWVILYDSSRAPLCFFLLLAAGVLIFYRSSSEWFSLVGCSVCSFLCVFRLPDGWRNRYELFFVCPY